MTGDHDQAGREPGLTELEDFLLQLDGTLADMEAARRKGYLLRDTRTLRALADRIRASRRAGRQP